MASPSGGYLALNTYYVKDGTRTVVETIPSGIEMVIEESLLGDARYEIEGYHPADFARKFTSKDMNNEVVTTYIFYIPNYSDTAATD